MKWKLLLILKKYLNKLLIVKFVLTFLSFALFLFACGNEPGNGRPLEPKPTSTPEKENPPIIDIPFKESKLRFEQLHSKVFKNGKLTDFTDSCKFYFECDCCFGEMIFKPDSNFYYLEYCMSDIAVPRGKYVIKNNQLVLKYSGLIRSKEYNWEHELDSTQIEFFLKDTTVTSWIHTYEIQSCNNKLAFISKNTEETFILLETKDDFKEGINYLKEDGLID